MAKRWYSVSVLSNFEKKIAEQIRQKAEEQGLADAIDEVLIESRSQILSQTRRATRLHDQAAKGKNSQAGMTHIDFIERDNLEQALPLFVPPQIRAEFTGTGSFNVLTDSIVAQ